jgi:hypothetical protein
MKKEHMSGFAKEHLHDIKTGEGLEVGSVHPSHTKMSGKDKGFGLHGPKTTVTKGESNLETLRQGNKPQAQPIRHAQQDMTAQKRAHGYTERSKMGGANKMAYPGCK